MGLGGNGSMGVSKTLGPGSSPGASAKNGGVAKW